MVTPYLPYPPFSGGQTRSFHLLKNLSRYAEITLFSFLLPDQKKRHNRELLKYCRKVVTVPRGRTWNWRKILFTGFSPYPFLVANYFSPEMKRLISRELKKESYDLLHIECFYLMPNIPKTKLPVLLVDQTIEFAVYQHYTKTLSKKLFLLKPFLYLDVAKIKFWEIFYWRRADRLLAVSEEDREIMTRFSHRQVELVPNGVDKALLDLPPQRKYPRPTVLYGVANFKWMQNKEGAVKLLMDIWPKLKKRVPEARLLIVGKHASEFIKKKGLLPYCRDVRVSWARDKVSIYQKSWILLAPMASGGGSRTKFFEAMALGLPIITTPAGIEGIRVKRGREVLVGKSDGELVDLAATALRHQRLRQKMGAAARRLVRRQYTWQQSSRKLYFIYEGLSK